MTPHACATSSLASRLVRSARRGGAALMLAVVAACGGGGAPVPLASTDAPAAATAAALDPGAPASSASGEPTPSVPPVAPTVSATGISGALKLAWTASADASSYRVQKRLDGGDWLDDGPPLAAGTLAADRPVPVAQWTRARFRVQACNAAGCTASADVQAAASMAATLRFLKASNTGTADQFGRSVALSADGNTLAVGAAGEDSADTGSAGTGADDASTNSGAVYVFVRSNGAWVQQAYLKAANAGSGDAFGWRVALSADGGTLAVGAVGESSGETGTAGAGADDSAQSSGAVYVFVRGNAGWAQQAYLKASNTGSYDRFGSSLALSADGGTLAVGADGEASGETGTAATGADNSAPQSGAVYVFVRSATTWVQQAYLKASNAGMFDQFGVSVALSADGGTLAVGASGEASAETGTLGTGAGNTASSSGAAYVFVRSGGSWTQQAYLKASNTGAGDLFGSSVALSTDGGTLAVGAPGEDGDADATPNSGAVYVFVHGNGGWTQQAYLKPSNAGPDDGFGSSVALSADGGALAVGAYGEASADTGAAGTGADDSASFSGAAYVFARVGGAWTQRAYLKASNTGAGDRFGGSVALSNDGVTLAVGASEESSAETGTTGTGADDSASGSGAVYVY